MMTDRQNMHFRFWAYLHLTLDHSEGQHQGHAYFDWEYLNSYRYGKHYYVHQIRSPPGYGQGQCYVHLTADISQTLTDMATIIIVIK